MCGVIRGGRGEYEKLWQCVKKEHCSDVCGTRHTADMYILARDPAVRPTQHDLELPGGIPTDVKLARMTPSKSEKTGNVTVWMPNGELQTLIGQCFLSSLRHDYAIGVFGHLRRLHHDKWQRDTDGLVAKLHLLGIYLVMRGLSALVVDPEYELEE